MATEMLEQLLAEPDVAAALDRAVADHNADPDALDRLLDQQNYRLAWWQAADRDLGYRRFFDVNTLIGLRVQNPDVFRATHRLLSALVCSLSGDRLPGGHVGCPPGPDGT